MVWAYDEMCRSLQYWQQFEIALYATLCTACVAADQEVSTTVAPITDLHTCSGPSAALGAVLDSQLLQSYLRCCLAPKQALIRLLHHLHTPQHKNQKLRVFHHAWCPSFLLLSLLTHPLPAIFGPCLGPCISTVLWLDGNGLKGGQETLTPAS
jgi:hypothetical protein